MVISFLINDTYCGTIDDNTAIICYGSLIIYRGLRMASGDVYDRDDGYIAKPDDGDGKNKSLVIAYTRL